VLALLSYVVDRFFVDGLVNLVGKFPAIVGYLFRSLQNGMVQFYALAMVLGLIVLLATNIGLAISWLFVVLAVLVLLATVVVRPG
jgi:hypothetical protein